MGRQDDERQHDRERRLQRLSEQGAEWQRIRDHLHAQGAWRHSGEQHAYRNWQRRLRRAYRAVYGPS